MYKMVLVGEGNNPGEYWWVVSSGLSYGWLTNIPSEQRPSGSTVIPIDREHDALVEWPAAKLALLHYYYNQVTLCAAR